MQNANQIDRHQHKYGWLLHLLSTHCRFFTHAQTTLSELFSHTNPGRHHMQATEFVYTLSQFWWWGGMAEINKAHPCHVAISSPHKIDASHWPGCCISEHSWDLSWPVAAMPFCLHYNIYSAYFATAIGRQHKVLSNMIGTQPMQILAPSAAPWCWALVQDGAHVRRLYPAHSHGHDSSDSQARREAQTDLISCAEPASAFSGVWDYGAHLT